MSPRSALCCGWLQPRLPQFATAILAGLGDQQSVVAASLRRSARLGCCLFSVPIESLRAKVNEKIHRGMWRGDGGRRAAAVAAGG